MNSVSAGLADVPNAIPVTPKTLFLSASTTKFLTAILALQSARRGEVALDATVAEWLPEAPGLKGISLAMLLAHRAGLANPNPMSWVHSPAEASQFDEKGAMTAVLRRYPESRAWASYRYSNLGYWVAGAVLERATGKPFATLVSERLMSPLGLSPLDMSVALPGPGSLARGHVRRFRPIHAALGFLYPWQIDRSSGRWVRLAPLLMNGPAYGGIFARAEAYLKIGEDLLQAHPRLLGAGDRDALLDAHEAAPGTANPFGLKVGRLNGQPYLGKPGGGPGFASNFRIYPACAAVSVWLANALCFSERRIERLSDRLDKDLAAAGGRVMSSPAIGAAGETSADP